jgi:hypothetical protein
MRAQTHQTPALNRGKKFNTLNCK